MLTPPAGSCTTETYILVLNLLRSNLLDSISLVLMRMKQMIKRKRISLVSKLGSCITSKKLILKTIMESNSGGKTNTNK